MPLINIKAVENVLSDAQKQEIASRITDTFADVVGEPVRDVTWVIIEEVRSGDLPGERMRCVQCALVVDAAAFEHDQVLLSACCCPRCDGPLVRLEASSDSAHSVCDPSIYLG
jgi:4-oxalocrotonate tautomerase